MGSSPLKYRNINDPIEKVMTAPQNLSHRYPRRVRATPDVTIKATPRTEAKLKREPKKKLSSAPAKAAYSNITLFLCPMEMVGINLTFYRPFILLFRINVRGATSLYRSESSEFIGMCQVYSICLRSPSPEP